MTRKRAITKSPGKRRWFVWGKKTGRKLGTFTSRAKAKRQLRAVERSMHSRKRKNTKRRRKR